MKDPFISRHTTLQHPRRRFWLFHTVGLVCLLLWATYTRISVAMGMLNSFISLEEARVVSQYVSNRIQQPPAIMSMSPVERNVSISAPFFPRHDNDHPHTAHCYFRSYPRPNNIHSGLPFVGEVFAAPDRSVVYVAAEGRKYCQKRFRKVDFFAHRKRTWTCIYTDGSQTLSRRLHKTTGDVWSQGFILIECPVPEALQARLPSPGARTTDFFLTLQAHPQAAATHGNSSSSTHGNSLDSPPQLTNLPICSHVWPSEEEAEKSLPKAPLPKYKLALMTRLAVSYQRGSNQESLSVTHVDFVAWIEYHKALGIPHFYIYDNTLAETPLNSTIRKWCQPYVKQGLVTYVYYPYTDIKCDDDSNRLNGKILYTGQIVSTNAALRRLENQVEWLGHWDVDEYLSLSSLTQSYNESAFDPAEAMEPKLHQFWNRFLRSMGNGKDEIILLRKTYGECPRNSTSNASNTSTEMPSTHTNHVPLLSMEAKQCWKLRGGGSPKGLFRTATVNHFIVHTARMTRENEPPSRRTIVLEEGHIAHFRVGQAVAKQTFVDRSNAFDSWADLVRTRVGQHWQSAASTQ